MHNLLILLMCLFILGCSSNVDDKSQSVKSKVTQPESNVPAKHSLDEFTGECKECYDEKIVSDSLIQHFITYYNNEPFKPSSGFGPIGCKDYIPKTEKDFYKAVEILIDVMHDTTLGTGTRAGLLTDLTDLTTVRFRHPHHNEVLPDLSVDTIEAYLLNQWDIWWKENKKFTAVDWNIHALQRSHSKYSRSIAIGNLALIGDSVNSCDPLFEALDTVAFEDWNNQNAYIIPVLVQFKDKRVIPFIIRYYLQNQFKYMREYGEQYIQEMTGKTFGYSATASYRNRKAAIKRCWAYWEQENSK